MIDFLSYCKNLVHIYFDMDGVICDFEHGWMSCHGEEIKVSAQRENYGELWKTFVYSAYGYEKLQQYKFFNIFTSILKGKFGCEPHVEILTSVTNYPTAPSIVRQKEAWLKKNYPSETPRLNYVYTRKEKGIYGWKHGLLIDDSLPCIDAFKENGGYGVYVDPDMTIEGLQEAIWIQLEAMHKAFMDDN